jgi:uncharacterized coiled-coil DUF342 family protein
MSTDERLLRLENAFATLAELAGGHNECVSSLEQSFQTLVELARSVDGRMSQHLAWINQLGEAQANSEARIAALANAQIRTDESLAKLAEAHAKIVESHTKIVESHTKLAESQTKLAESQTKLAEAQAHTDQRLDALIDIVRESRNGKS